MSVEKYRFQRLDKNAAEAIIGLFLSVFTQEPWNDDWSDKNQLKLYIDDLTGQKNSLTFGLYEENTLIGLSMGHIRHWYTGTEYFIDELCIDVSKQRKGAGTLLVEEIMRACRDMGMKHIFLLTENNVPAYEFYKKLDFKELQNNAAFAKKL